MEHFELNSHVRIIMKSIVKVNFLTLRTLGFLRVKTPNLFKTLPTPPRSGLFCTVTALLFCLLRFLRSSSFCCCCLLASVTMEANVSVGGGGGEGGEGGEGREGRGGEERGGEGREGRGGEERGGKGRGEEGGEYSL